MKIIKNFLLLIAVVLFINCSKDSSEEPQTDDDPVSMTDDDPIVTLSAEKDLVSFSITQANNPDLKIDADVQQTGTSLKVFLPFGTDMTNLTISFEVSDNASLIIDGSTVASGSSNIDLTSDISAIVQAEDGTTQDYNIIAESDFEVFDSSMIELMQQYNAPSIQLAITKGERLVYQANYGFASLDNSEMATAESLYRLASVSKVITAVTVLKMVSDGSLQLDDTVFGVDGVLGTDFGTTPYKENVENITVGHLLGHTSGFNNTPNNPMFQNFDWPIEMVIDDVLNNRDLATIPGTTYFYSNFGYALLGRVISKASGMDYETYVKQNILAPMGITSMRIAGNTLSDRFTNEVEYFGQTDLLGPYELNPNRADSTGGWIGSATDLVRFMSFFDRNGQVPDIISEELMQGLYLEQLQWVFQGSLPGSSSAVVRYNNEYNYSIVANTRYNGIEFNSAMVQAFLPLFVERTSWPEYDLFSVE